ncbi:ATP-dependent helicase [Paludibacter sp. 221]|uniref:UvrD-helicase domain-containing protein n=1 Tax=Paludibacter sp. 221 TaxID=2302939 RepID=UPI0013D8BFA5|nr:UvrD-helicase domain-containing protein [Paludibacter sp. 221]NDV47804.1 ATP-dependent helicase [Paludibacter sp. 221]
MLNIYRASAGSGKTYRLTQDYIQLLFDPKKERTHRRILAVTFTNKATDEMKSRILNELYILSKGEKSDYRKGLMERYKMSDEAVDERARRVLVQILHDYSSFSISTIDRFFQQVIRAFARDIGVNGAYSLELDVSQTLEQAVDNLFLDLSKEDNRQLLSWLTQLAEERIEQSESWNMRRSIAELGKEIFKENFQHKAEDTSRKLHDREFLNAYRKNLQKIKNDFEEKVKGKASEALQIIAINGLTTESFKGGARSAMKTLEKLQKRDFKVSDTFFTFTEDVTFCYTKTTPKGVVADIETAYHNGLRQCLVHLANYLTKDIVNYNSADIVLKHLNTLGILSDLAMQIKALTEEQNTMLISDTNMLLNKIIDSSDTPFVYERTGVYVDNYMIDEFQDTSVLQWKNFKPLMGNSLADGKFNLVVGDVKQSIYRWRNSDWNLLDEQIMRDFRKDQTREENLDTNWRSDRNIIDFNNSFFKQASQLLQSKLNENLEPVLPVYKMLKPLKTKIVHAYDNLYQKASHKAGNGRVEINFIDKKESEDGWKQESLRRLPQLLEHLQDKGYNPANVALLVRKNDEEQAVIQYLLNYKTTPEARQGYCYDVMGNEGLLVSAASSVRFLLGVLQLYINPSDSIQRSIVNYEYLRGKHGCTEEEALNRSFAPPPDSVEKISPLFSDEENRQLANIRHHSLYDMVEQIIALFGVGGWHNESVFVQSFQDIVLRFSVGKTADLNSFLKWWDKNGAKQTVPSPENQQSFRIMTIHKSKGLDFPVVIIPFCDWDLDSRMRNILWCEPKEAPFNEFPLLPIEYSTKLSQSVFAADYFDEQMHQYIDNLNIAYVAFTRAKNELICFAPAPQREVTELGKMNSLAALLSVAFRLNPSTPDGLIQLSGHYHTDEKRFVLGEDAQAPASTKKAETENEKITSYPTVSSADRLKIRHQSLDFWLENQQLTDSRINYGTVMHSILQEINHREDEEKVIQEFVRNGFISQKEAGIVRNDLATFWQIPGVQAWFAPGTKILNEATIITPKGDLYRPDRVVIKDNTATVIDYKFGNIESKHHIRQVKQYMDLIAGMGYEVKGFVCYVSLKKIVEV